MQIIKFNKQKERLKEQLDFYNIEKSIVDVSNSLENIQASLVKVNQLIKTINKK